MAKKEKKADNINGNYPMFGWRLQKGFTKELMAEFEEVESRWNQSKSAPASGYKRNDLFYRAMKAGLEHLKKNVPK